MRIVRVVGFGMPATGEDTVLEELGRGYLAAGHDPVLVRPGPEPGRSHAGSGWCCTVPGLPYPGGRRMVAYRRPLLRVLEDLAADRLEVCDQLTLGYLGPWARANGVPALLVARRRLDALLRTSPWLPAERAADAWNRRLSRRFDKIVVASRYGAAEFQRIAARNVVRVPFGVDLSVFHPGAADQRWRGTADVLLATVTGLYPGKRPMLAVRTLAELRRAGVDARLVVAGDGPLLGRLRQAAEGLPVSFAGHLSSRAEVAGLLAAADVALATAPAQTFGLATLEALACGTPVVTPDEGALPELLATGAGRAVPAEPAELARAVCDLLDPRAGAAARARAELFPWAAAVTGMLRAHAAR
ncbi:glycosyltransferase [Microtetraspora sp. NBRC 13810]|uniref:glycosyltransferase n=1 Tax=Microtetraspora sp. NBRC 13810 TaxID=3030990 RepID=UPI002557425D|nr:glycosyltransferase [Microtetraspora sp. NBRC 13810]